MTTVAELVVTGLLGAGGGSIVGASVSAWQTRKKVPAEVDSIIVSGAETAVQTLIDTLAAETTRADRAEAMVRERDAKIEVLEKKIDALQAALDAVREELYSMKEDRL